MPRKKTLSGLLRSLKVEEFTGENGVVGWRYKKIPKELLLKNPEHIGAEVRMAQQPGSKSANVTLKVTGFSKAPNDKTIVYLLSPEIGFRACYSDQVVVIKHKPTEEDE